MFRAITEINGQKTRASIELGNELSKFKPGDMVNVKDIALGVDKVLRVQKISKNLITDEVESIEIADAYEINFASKLILDVKEIKNVVNITKLGEINYSKLGLKTTEELKNLVFDTDGLS